MELGGSILIRALGATDNLIATESLAGGSVVVVYPQAEGVNDIGVMIAPYPDANRIGGLVAVLQSAVATGRGPCSVHFVEYCAACDDPQAALGCAELYG